VATLRQVNGVSSSVAEIMGEDDDDLGDALFFGDGAEDARARWERDRDDRARADFERWSGGEP